MINAPTRVPDSGKTPAELAALVGLRHVRDTEAGITRRITDEGFSAYVSDMMSRDSLRSKIVAELPALLEAYPKEAQLARNWLQSALSDEALIGDVAEQISEASGFGIGDPTPV